MKQLKKITDVLIKLLWILTSCCLIMLIILVSCQVLARFNSLHFLAPPDEIVTLLFVLLTYCGSIILTAENGMLRVEFIETFFHAKGKMVCRLIQDFIVSITSLLLAYSCINLFIGSLKRTSPMLHLPQGLWYFPLVLCFIITTIYAFSDMAVNCIKIFRGQYEA